MRKHISKNFVKMQTKIYMLPIRLYLVSDIDCMDKIVKIISIKEETHTCEKKQSVLRLVNIIH